MRAGGLVVDRVARGLARRLRDVEQAEHLRRVGRDGLGEADELHARAHKEGAAAQGAVQGKRRKYAPDKHPAATLVPFAVEALGRPSEEALQFLRDLAPSDPSERAW